MRIITDISRSFIGSFRNPHFWVITVILAALAFFYYSFKLTPDESVGVFPYFRLNRLTLEWIILLVPGIYSSFVFGIKGGLATLVFVVIILLPRAISYSTTASGVWFEVISVIFIGGVLVLNYGIYQRYVAQRKTVENMLVSIFDGSPIPIFALNGQHKITHWNTAMESLTGLKKEEMIGTDGQWKAFYPDRRVVMADLILDSPSPEEVEKYYQGKSRKSLLIKDAYEVEDVFWDMEGEGKWFHFTASPIREDNDKIIGAIETLQDITERKKAEDNLRNYLKEITRAQEEERKRIAWELHDSTAQNLIALLHQMDNLLNSRPNLPVREAKTLWGFHEQIRGILEEVRAFSRDLRPSILDDLGLLPALEWVIGEIKKEHHIEVGLKINNYEPRLTPEAELIIFRIVQEALRNTVKHAKASRAEVKMECVDNIIRVMVSDNGVGFRPPDNLGDLTRSGKLGLIGMRERVQLLNGRFEIRTEPGKGTCILVQVPL